MRPVEVLRAARELLSEPERWTKGLFCRVVDGWHCCCVMGAFVAVCPTDIAFHCSLFRRAAGVPDEMPLSEWNDAPERTHAEVLAAFDKAIELAEQEAGEP